MKIHFSFFLALILLACTNNAALESEIPEATEEETTEETADELVLYTEDLERIFYQECEMDLDCAFEAFSEYNQGDYWTGVSYMSAEYRGKEDFESALGLTEKIVEKDPAQEALMLIWDADTYVGSGNLSNAVSALRDCEERFGSEPLFDVTYGVIALQHLSTFYGTEGLWTEAALVERELLSKYSSYLYVEQVLAEIFAYQVYANSPDFEQSPIGYLLSEDICSQDRVCVVADNKISFAENAPSRFDYEFYNLYFSLSEQDKELLEYLEK